MIARILDPLRAEWYREQGLRTICPTKVAIEMLEDKLRSVANPTSLDAGTAEYADTPPAPPADANAGGGE